MRTYDQSDYPFIEWWGYDVMGSATYYVEDQKKQARRDRAPRTAIYPEHDHNGPTGRWETIHNITATTTLFQLERTFGEDILEREKERS